MKKIVILFLAVIPLSCFSQFTITGKVKNGSNHQPVALASVFLSNSSIGSKTDDNGKFILQNVEPGKYEMIISVIGYETYSATVAITNNNLELKNILITPSITRLKEVVIKSGRPHDENRDDYLAWFKDEFLGKSPLAADCKILNPEILDLRYNESTKTLDVTAPDFLEIDNPSLGYHLKYLLHNFKLAHKGDTNEYVHFEGWALFKQMKGSVSKQDAWQTQRLMDYEGSPMHFLRAIIAPQLNALYPVFFQEGFWVLRLVTYANPLRPGDSLIRAKINYFIKYEDQNDRDSLNKWKKIAALPKLLKKLYPDILATDDFVKPTDQTGIYALGLTRKTYSLFINYEKDRLKQMHNGAITLDKRAIDNLGSPKNTENSLVDFNSAFAFFDRNGQILNVNSTTLSGVWARRRIADLLPVDYVPPIKKTKTKKIKREHKGT